MTTQPFDPKKPVQTRSGMKARIYALDGGGPCSVHGAFWVEAINSWNPTTWTLEGRFLANEGRDSGYDLLNLPEKLTKDVWIWWWDNGLVETAMGEPPFGYRAGLKAFKKITVEITAGEGL